MSLAPSKDVKVTPDTMVGDDCLAGQCLLFLLGGKGGLFVPYQALILQEYVGDERLGKAKFRHLSLDCDMKSSFDSCYINNNYLTS